MRSIVCFCCLSAALLALAAPSPAEEAVRTRTGRVVSVDAKAGKLVYEVHRPNLRQTDTIRTTVQPDCPVVIDEARASLGSLKAGQTVVVTYGRTQVVRVEVPPS